MARKQTRRSVSIKAETYSQLKIWCDSNGRSMSSAVEEALVAFLPPSSAQEIPITFSVTIPPPSPIRPSIPGGRRISEAESERIRNNDFKPPPKKIEKVKDTPELSSKKPDGNIFTF